MEPFEFQDYSDLIECQARTLGEKPYLYYEDEVISFAQFYQATCRAANGLKVHGGEPENGIAILMDAYSLLQALRR